MKRISKIKMLLALLVVGGMSSCKDESPAPKNEPKGNDDIQISAIPSLEISVNENLPNGTKLMDIAGFSPLGDVVLSIKSQSPAGALTLDDASGKLTVADKAKLDFETNPVLTCVIRGTVGQEWNEVTAKIQLIDIEEFPTIQELLNSGKMPWEIYASNVKYTDSSMIGKDFQGGVIFYYDDDVNNEQVWIVAKDNIGSFAWGCMGTTISKSGNFMGAGPEATEAIANECADANIAAKKCLNLTLAGYSDWYLPTKSELFEIGFGPLGLELANKINWKEGDKFWTSTQISGNQATCVHVDIQGYADNPSENKDQMILVRPVRTIKK